MSRRSFVRLTGAALCVAVATGIPAPASAQPPATTPQDAPSVVEQHTITLITGDVVDLQVLSTGQVMTTVKPTNDRSGTGYTTRTVNKSVYLVPNDAAPLLAAGKLDRDLFNLNALIANGYADAESPATSIIVQYEPGQAQAQVAGTNGHLTLESINAVSVLAAKEQAATFWTTLAGEPGATTALAGGIRKIWLNRKVSAALTESVPQVGAPQAWAGGYDGTGAKIAVLDTGIDSTHPDLDGGKVIAAANFSSDTDPIDHHGHGTHVASTAAGTGEATPAARKGVAPGASLLNAKVLNSGGSGTMDQVIEGLEWAAAQGADVANMSIGFGEPANGNDPLTQAVDAISQSSGMLVVAAAGNFGENGESTIVTPGWADEALTVGAVDKQDSLAEFSSRGPRLGDYGIKPDITGPGVDIVAARAAGTQIGPIVDERYQQISGTSMATPHVAGAAAILSQEFPGYTNRQLKDALISTAKTSAEQTVHEQGGGRLDVARAFAQHVYASPGTLNLGFFTFPHTGQQPVTKTVSYTNDTAADVTLELSLQLSGKDSGPAPNGMFALSQPSVTVPVKGTASVTVTINPSAGPADRYSGYLVGKAGEVVVHTSVGSLVEPEMYNVTVSGIAKDGRPASSKSFTQLWNLDTADYLEHNFSPAGSTATFRVPPGKYSLAGYLATLDAANSYATGMAFLTEPELEVKADRAVTLDARKANQLVVNTRKPTAPAGVSVSYHRDAEGGSLETSVGIDDTVTRFYAAPTTAVTKGNFEFYTKWRLVAPPLRMSGPSGLTLEPRFMFRSPPVDGEHTRPLAYVGSGKPADYAGRNVHGRIALIQRTPGMTFNEQIVNAANAGAWAALIFNDRPGLLVGTGGDQGTVPIPAIGIEQGSGTALRDQLRHRPVWLLVSGTSTSPYLYDLVLPEKQRVPRSLAYTIDRDNTVEIDTRYTADVTGGQGGEFRQALRPFRASSAETYRVVPRPLRRTEYVSANDTQWLHIAASTVSTALFRDGFVRYQPRTRLSESWFGRVSRPGASSLGGNDVFRTGDSFSGAIYPFSDASGHYGLPIPGDVLNTKLYAGSQLLKETDGYPIRGYPALAKPATYRLVFNAKRSTPWSRYATETNTAWTFTSRRPAEGKQEHPPIMQLDYDLALDEHNRARAGRNYWFTMNVGYVPGANGPGRARVQAWASFNDGATWTKLDLRDLGDGKRQASVRHPRVSDPSAAVSLRVTATDVAGNSIDQTIYRAYGLRPGT